VVRLEEGPHGIEVLLPDGVVLVVVALGAVERQAEQALAHVLDRLIEPLCAVPAEPVTGQETGGPQPGRVVGIELVGGQHLPQHLVVGDVGVERLDDPIAKVPDVLLAVAMIVAQPPPVAVTPDVHPVAAPTFPVPRIGQQPIDETLVPVRRAIGHERRQVFGRGRQADEVEEQPPHEHVAWGLGLRLEAVPLVVAGQEGVDGIPRAALPGGQRNGGHLGPQAWLEGPVVSRVGFGSFVGRGLGAGVDPCRECRHLGAAERLGLALGRHAGGRIGVADAGQDQAGC